MNTWEDIINQESKKKYFLELMEKINFERTNYIVYPKEVDIFKAFELTPLNKVKVVLLGQDPYHNIGQAHGLCFSVPDGIAHPKSLINIFKELHDDIGCAIPQSGNLEKWAKQGVLLLNATLTVRAHEAGSHQNRGWEVFTDTIIKKISANKSGVVFLLWGNYAQAKIPLIDASKHCILKTVHPSPLSASRGFFGCKNFSKTNQYLINTGQTPIEWDLTK